MKKIYIKPFNSPVFYNNAIFNINNGHNIFYQMDERLLEAGIKIETIDKDQNDGDCYFFCDLPYPWEIQNWKKLLTTKGRKVLLVFESPIVNPFNHIKFLYSLFDYVYTWDNSVKKDNKIREFRIPQVKHDGGYHKNFSERTNFISLINSNKLSPLPFKLLSPYKFDGYEERLRAIKFLDEKYPNGFHLYGPNWNTPRKLSIKDRLFGFDKFNTYRGPAKSKYEVLGDSKFCLCYENAVAPGYFTEKIFDCFVSGCIPIYIGPPDIENFIPKEAFINKNNFANYDELTNYIENLSDSDAEAIIKVGRDFLNNELTRKGYFESYFTNLLVEITNS